MLADKNVNLTEAKELVSKAVSLDPTSGAYLDSLGWVYFRLGDFDRAEKHLTEAVRLEPLDATVHEHLGDLFKLRGDAAKATEAYRKALTLELEDSGQKERIEKKIAELPRTAPK
jgi:Flp pilus assembly protein TadD